MSIVKNFYNGLDFLNLILFWGIVIVVILIVLFLILYFSRRKATNVTYKKNNDFDFDDIDIIKRNNSNINVKKISDDKINVIEKDKYNMSIKTISDDDIDEVNEEINLDDTMDIPIQKKEVEVKIDNTNEEIPNKNNITIERDNVIERDNNKENINVTIERKEVIEEKSNNNVITDKSYNLDRNNNNINITIEKKNTLEVKKDNDEFIFDELVKKDNNDEKPKAYQKNVFREMNIRNQTSPIGIIYETKPNEIEEYKESLDNKKDTYLEDVYSNLSKANVPDRVELTEYEKKQEEDAVISYQELLKKKDNVDYDKEEDVVISYGELVNRNSRLYNIREEEEDKEFLSELKEFRKDL